MKVKSKLVRELRGSLKPGKHAEKLTAETTYGKRMRLGRATAPVKRYSPSQDSWRAKFSDCVDGWNDLTPEEKEPYEKLGRQLKLTGYQVYISQCLLEIVATEVIQSDKTKLHATVHFDGTDNVVSGTVTCKRGEPDYTPIIKIGQWTTAQSAAVLWDPTTGKKFVVTDIFVSAAGAVRVTLQDGTTARFRFELAENGGAVSNLQTPWKSAAINNNLTVWTSADVRVNVTVLGYEV